VIIRESKIGKESLKIRSLW